MMQNSFIRNLSSQACKVIAACVFLSCLVASECAWAQTAPQPTPRYVGALGSNYKGRKINSISLQGSTTAQQTITCGNDLAYIDKTGEHFVIREGETTTATFAWVGNWMHGYIYIDKDQNGTYDNIALGTNGVPTVASELVAFSAYQVSNNNWRKSDGTATNNNPGLNPPAFSAPSTAGVYYMRYMSDWNCIDPYGSSGDFELHGGVAIDTKLWVVKAYTLTIVDPDGRIDAGANISIDGGTESSYVANGTVLCTKPALTVSDVHASDSRGETPVVTVSGTNITVTFRAKQIVKTPITSLSEITDAEGYYILTQDINASGASVINGFMGTLDGQFHKITGLNHAIFSSVNGATIKNVILDDVSISSGINVGAIANEASGDARIYNCGVLATTGSSISGSGNVGSIVGTLSGNARVLNCFSYADVSGGTVGGIVGNNNGTAVNRNTILDGTGSMVFNCMFFGTVSGSNKYPVFGGNTIENVYNTSNAQTTGINTYNYFLYDGSSTFTAVNSAAGVIEQSYLNRFNLYRDMLNSHRDLCAMYIYGRETISNEMRHDIALWDYTAETKATIPYLHLEKLQTNTQRTLSRSIPSTGEDYAGKQVGTVSCTFNINGQSFSRSLPLTDMDVDNYDFTWGKIILPFANEFSGWTLPSSGSNDYDKVITGWEITKISGGTAGAAPTAANHYNLCDPNCTAKDLYANTYYVWAQGGNYVVPDGVTSITFTAHIVNAYYLCDPYPDEGFNNNYNTSCYIGSQRSGDTYNGKTIYHTLQAAYEKMGPFTNPADQAVVLVGNYHLNTNNNGHTDSQVWPNASGSRAYQTKAATIMSIDADNNQVPDYALVSAVTFSSGRAYCPPTRFDFVCCPGQGITSYTRNGALPDVAIMHSAGWFEVTETSFMHLTEYEVRPQNFVNDNSPCILNGGIYEKFIYGSNLGNSGNNNKFAYFKFGGNVYITDFNPGHKGGSNDPNVTYNPKPVNMSGGQIDLLYMSGKNYNFTQTGDSYFFSNGGYIKLYQGANQAQLIGNITTQIHHALIDEYYGGGAVAKYDDGQITGDISNTINDSYVKFYVAGPKFGDMAPGKTVTTVANGTTFGQYYGAGYGGTSLVSNSESSASVAFSSADRDYGRPWNTFTGKRLRYNPDYGTCVSFSRLYFIYAGGGVPGNMNGNENFLNEYASLSLAKTNNVSSALTNCKVEANFYGGGCQGMVDGTIFSTLEGCNVAGSVFGGGYKADATPITVYSATEPSRSVFKASMGFFTPFGAPEIDTYTWVSGTDGAVDNSALTIGTSVDMTQMGLVTGIISITVDGGTVGQNVYGGGNESPADASTNVVVQSNAQVAGSVFGGGNQAPIGQNTDVKILGNSTVQGNVYGGGNQGQVGGKTNVQIGEDCN